MVSFTEDNGLMPGKYIAVLTGKGELDPDTLNNINTFAGL
jgi:hypothetical protein